MLPLTLLNAAVNKPVLVELKNGETFNGHLTACDNFMNVMLRDVYQTSAIKYCRVADALIDAVKESEEHARKQRQSAGSGRGRGDMGRGRNDGRGRGRNPRTQRV
ncbi:hypothetical protein MVES1_000191 [Malassezia vespertilionis]|uniref:uncharacterized protein n=1 Tax=Malassezia vespertilionis TaxID=2020962 RepID=UPI0024B0EE44|nr:uncharacterized protein MVES1_000191 [Malassezia vespertilionis]WFD04867.1 hypothetical protein MVES1_000191 [Malassezia vespertilionis]